MFYVVVKFYCLINNIEYWNKFEMIENFFFVNNFINSFIYLMSDGIDLDICKFLNIVGFIYEIGVLIGVFFEMYRLMKNEFYFGFVENLVFVVIDYNSNMIGVFMEKNCDLDCDDDVKMFKGIFVRNLWYFMDIVNNVILCK